MFCYSFAAPYDRLSAPSPIARIDAMLPTVSSNCRVQVTYSEKPRTESKIKYTMYKGEHVEPGATLSDFVETISTEPTCKATYDTAEVGFKKIDCIKDVRRVTGLDLKKAKELIETLAVQKAVITVITHVW